MPPKNEELAKEAAEKAAQQRAEESVHIGEFSSERKEDIQNDVRIACLNAITSATADKDAEIREQGFMRAEEFKKFVKALEWSNTVIGYYLDFHYDAKNCDYDAPACCQANHKLLSSLTTEKELSSQQTKIEMLQADVAEWKQAETEVSDAYLRVRTLLNAFDTKPGGVDRFEVTENKIKDLQAKIEMLERQVGGKDEALMWASDIIDNDINKGIHLPATCGILGQPLCKIHKALSPDAGQGFVKVEEVKCVIGRLAEWDSVSSLIYDILDEAGATGGNLPERLKHLKQQIAGFKEHLQFIADQPCERVGEFASCANMCPSLCVTEFCLPCFAKSALTWQGELPPSPTGQYKVVDGKYVPATKADLTKSFIQDLERNKPEAALEKGKVE